MADIPLDLDDIAGVNDLVGLASPANNANNTSLYANMTNIALKELARERGYVGFSGRNKAQLITMLQNDPNKYIRQPAPKIDPKDAEFPIGTILVVIECGHYSFEKEFAQVLGITPTGRYKVQLLNYIITHETGHPMYSTYIHKKPVLNTAKGHIFYITPEAHRGNWCFMEKYDPTKDYFDEHDHNN